MNESLWSDERFRTFLAEMRGAGIFGPAIDDTERSDFLRQAQVRVAPLVQKWMMGRVGTPLDPYGIALLTYEVLEDSAWEKPRAWLLATADPWVHLAEMVTRALDAAYRATLGVAGDGDGETLEGIAAASSRAALEAGEREGDGSAEV